MERNRTETSVTIIKRLRLNRGYGLREFSERIGALERYHELEREDGRFNRVPTYNEISQAVDLMDKIVAVDDTKNGAGFAITLFAIPLISTLFGLAAADFVFGEEDARTESPDSHHD